MQGLCQTLSFKGFSKPWQNEKLLATISSSVKLKRSRMEAKGLKSRQQEISAVYDQPFHEFIGSSVEMQKVFNTIKKVAATDANILILGENGTGKELVARALHRNSTRQDEVFISVDLGSIAETLFESELFGHEKGAFTDANKMKQGRFEIAHGGTLFLDEIGNLSLPMQTKLLTVIERREVTRVGNNKPIPVEVRLICATNIELAVGYLQFILFYLVLPTLFVITLASHTSQAPTKTCQRGNKCQPCYRL